jgi:hypothetical protein
MLAAPGAGVGAAALDEVVLVDVVALAIAAPPTAAAPIAALVTSTDLMFLMSLLCRLVERRRPIVHAACEGAARIV